MSDLSAHGISAVRAGLRVEFPVDRFEFLEGIVESFDEDSGLVVVLDDDGNRWKGYEYQLHTA